MLSWPSATCIRSSRSDPMRKRSFAACGIRALEAELVVDSPDVALPFALIFAEQAVGRRHSGGDHIAQRIEEAALIVAGAVELRATCESIGGDVEHPPCELAHRL